MSRNFNSVAWLGIYRTWEFPIDNRNKSSLYKTAALIGVPGRMGIRHSNAVLSQSPLLPYRLVLLRSEHVIERTRDVHCQRSHRDGWDLGATIKDVPPHVALPWGVPDPTRVLGEECLPIFQSLSEGFGDRRNTSFKLEDAGKVPMVVKMLTPF